MANYIATLRYDHQAFEDGLGIALTYLNAKGEILYTYDRDDLLQLAYDNEGLAERVFIVCVASFKSMGHPKEIKTPPQVLSAMEYRNSIRDEERQFSRGVDPGTWDEFEDDTKDLDS